MIRSLFAGISGMKIHQLGIEVVGNDLANVNTVGYKSKRARFEDLLNQTLQGATAGGTNTGGVNPIQVGLGAKLSAVDSIFSQGSLQTTGRSLDLAIEGDGFFKLVGPSNETYYSRAGAFDTDSEGYLVDPATGYKVQGFQWNDVSGIFTQPSENIQIDYSSALQGEATSSVNFGGNLDSSDTTGQTTQSSINIYDPNSQTHTLTVTLTKTSQLQWTYAITSTTGTITNGSGTLNFNENGSLDTSTIPNFTFDPTGSVTAFTITPNFGTVDSFDGVTSFANDTNFAANDQNGFASGSIKSVAVDNDGIITGQYTNGEIINLYQLALAKFNNPGGLYVKGASYFQESPNSGTPVELSANQGGIGRISPATLERSNVDLSEAFVEMILQQRGYQANARTIATTDQILQEAVNLRR